MVDVKKNGDQRSTLRSLTCCAGCSRNRWKRSCRVVNAKSFLVSEPKSRRDAISALPTICRPRSGRGSAFWLKTCACLPVNSPLLRWRVFSQIIKRD